MDGPLAKYWRGPPGPICTILMHFRLWSMLQLNYWRGPIDGWPLSKILEGPAPQDWRPWLADSTGNNLVWSWDRGLVAEGSPLIVSCHIHLGSPWLTVSHGTLSFVFILQFITVSSVWNNAAKAQPLYSSTWLVHWTLTWTASSALITWVTTPRLSS